MKLWEVIKALTEDPTKRFETKLASKGWTACMRVDTGFSRYFKFEVFNGKRLVDQSRDGGAFNGNVELDLDWQLVRQPVTWNDNHKFMFKGIPLKPELDPEVYSVPLPELAGYDGTYVYGWYVDGFIVGKVMEVGDEWIALEYWVPVDPETVCLVGGGSHA